MWHVYVVFWLQTLILHWNALDNAWLDECEVCKKHFSSKIPSWAPLSWSECSTLILECLRECLAPCVTCVCSDLTSNPDIAIGMFLLMHDYMNVKCVTSIFRRNSLLEDHCLEQNVQLQYWIAWESIAVSVTFVCSVLLSNSRYCTGMFLIMHV